MAKVKISEQKSFYLTMKREKREKKESFMILLKVLREACRNDYKITLAGTGDVIAVHFPIDQKGREEVRDYILTFLKIAGPKVGIKIEFEEEKKKEEKWIPVHEIFLKNPILPSVRNVPTFAFLYAEKGKAPKEAIPELLKFFEKELKGKDLHRPYGTYTYNNIEQAIKNLKEQQKEEKEKE
jgi:hypothetical protein